MVYKVIYKFADGKDNNRIYEAEAVYPVEGFEVSEARLKYLLDIGAIEEDEVDIDKLTKEEIIEILTKKGVDFDSKAKKEELVALLK